MNISIAVVIILLVGAYAFWVIRQARLSSCPNCARDGEDAPLLPVLFNLLWWCPNCGELQQSRIMRAAVKQATRDDTVRERLGGALRRRRQDDDEPREPEADEPVRPPSF